MATRAPAPPADGYYRLAVAQIDFNPAFVQGGHDLLGEPCPYGYGAPTLKDLSALHSQNSKRLQSLKTEIQRTYCAALAKRVEAIVAWCGRAGVELLAFPEYSIPAPLLPRLHEQARSSGLTVVAGTHHVTPGLIRRGTYKGFQSVPKTGSAVAPVLGVEQPLLIAKLTSTQWEGKSLQLGDQWHLVPWKDGLRYAVLICLDNYHQEDLHRAKFVTPAVLSDASFTVAISLTPKHSTEGLGHLLTAQLTGYHRPTLFVNHATDGGSKIFVLDSPDQPASEPLSPGEEVVIVWDVRLSPHSLRKPTGNQFIHPALPVATASVVEHGIMEGYASFLDEVEATSNLDALIHLLHGRKEQMEAWTQTKQVPKAVRERLNRVLEQLDDITDAEHARTLLRHINLDNSVPELATVRSYSTERALSEIQAILHADDHSPAFVDARSRLESLKIKLSKHAQPNSLWTNERLRSLASAWNPDLLLPVLGPAVDAALSSKGGDPAVSPLASLPRASEPSLFPVDLEGAGRIEAGPVEAAAVDAAGQKLGTDSAYEHPEIGSRPIPESPEFYGAPRLVWALLNEQIVPGPTKAEPVSSLIRLGKARGWTLRCRCRAPEEIDLLWWRDERAGHERLEVVPESCPRNYDMRLLGLRRRLAPIDCQVEWIIEPTPPKLQRELVALLDLEAHAHLLIARYDADAADLPSRYVSLSAKPLKGADQDAEALLSQWVDGTTPLLVLLGDFGGGKTTTLRRWARDCAERFLEAKRETRAPVLVDLRGVEGETKPVRLARRTLLPDDVQADDLLQLALEHGIVTLIFDGLDELLRRHAADPVAAFGQFTALSCFQGARLLVSCRTRHFASELALASDPQPDPWGQGGLLGAAVAAKAAIAVLQPLDADRLRRYLDACAPAQADALQCFISETPGLPSLATQPLLLSLLIALRGRLLTDGRRETALADLYRQYIEEWLNDPLAIFTSEQRESLVRVRARQEWNTGLATALDPRGPEWIELRSAPFFQSAKDGNLEFKHTSFLEYFLAVDIVRQLDSDSAVMLPDRPISPEVAAFLVGIFDKPGGSGSKLLDRQVRLALTVSERGAALCASYLVHACRSGVGEQLVSILAAAWGAGLRLDGVKLRSCQLRYASLRQANLSGADLFGGDLTGADFSGATLSQACLSQVQAAGACFDEAWLPEAQLDGGSLVGAFFRNCNLAESKLAHSVLTRAQMTGCNLSHAIMDGCDLREAVLVRAQMEGTSLCGADLTAASLYKARLDRAQLRCADLTHVDLRETTAHELDLSFATVHSAFLAGARMPGSQWAGVSLRATDLSEAIDLPQLDSSSQWPPCGSIEIQPRPIFQDGIWTWLGPNLGFHVLDWTVDQKVVFIRLPGDGYNAEPRTYAVDGGCGQILARFDQSITRLEFSPAGDRAIAVCASEAVLLLDTAALRVLRTEKLASGEPSFAFCATGTRLLLRSSQNQQNFLRLLDTRDGREIFSCPTGYNSGTWSYAPAGKTALFCDGNGVCQLVDFLTGQVLLRKEGLHSLSARSVGERLLLVAPVPSAPRNRRGRPVAWDMIWHDGSSGAFIGLARINGDLVDARLSPDGTRLVVVVTHQPEDPSWSEPEVVARIIDTSAAHLQPLFESEPVASCAISPSGDRLVIHDSSGKLSVRSTQTGEEVLASVKFMRNSGNVLQSYAFTVDSARLRCVVRKDYNYRESCHILDIEKKTWVSEAENSSATAQQVAQKTSTDSNCVRHGHRQALEKHGMVELWDGNVVTVRLVPQPTIVRLGLLPADRLLVAHGDGLVRMFTLTTGQQIWQHQAAGAPKYKLSPDRRRLFIQTDAAICALDLETAADIRIPLKPGDRYFVWNPARSYVALPRESSPQLQVFSAVTGKCTAVYTIPSESWSVRFICEDRLWLLDKAGANSLLMDADSGRILLSVVTLEKEHTVSPGGDFIATVDRRGLVIFETREGREILRAAKTSFGTGWSADGSWLAFFEVGAQSKCVRKNLRTGETIATAGVPVDQVLSVSQDGRRVLIVDERRVLAIIEPDGSLTKLTLDPELTIGTPPGQVPGVEDGTFSPSGTHLILRTQEHVSVMELSSGKHLWTSSVGYSFYRWREQWGKHLPLSFSADEKFFAFADQEPIELATGESGEKEPDRWQSTNERWRVKLRTDGTVSIYDAQSWAERVTLHVSGLVPYASSASGYLSLPERWSEVPCDVIVANGRHPLAAAALELNRPDLIAQELRGCVRPPQRPVTADSGPKNDTTTIAS